MKPRLALIPAVAVLLTACGHSSTKDPEMTPDEARERLSATIREVLEVGVPGSEPEFSSSSLTDAIPCGGLEGNEFTKIEHSVNAVTTARPRDAASALAAMQKKLTEFGYQSTSEKIANHDVLFFSRDHGDGGNIQINDSGFVSVDASTPCLDNPDE